MSGRARGMRGGWWVLCGAVSWILPVVTAGEAEAAGISLLSKFGGIYGHANAEGGLALQWNPARMTERDGGFLTLDTTLVRRSASIDRRVDTTGRDDVYIRSNTGENTISALAPLPYLAAGWTFDLSSTKLSLGAGFMPAFGGTADWDDNLDAPAEAPGAIYGPQRWSSIASSFIVLHTVGAVAFAVPDYGLSLGANVIFARGDINMVRSRNADRTDDLVDSAGTIKEGIIHFKGDDQAIGWTIGGSYTYDDIVVSVSYRSGYELVLRGPLRQTYATAPEITGFAQTAFPIPATLLTAFSFKVSNLTVTGATDYTTWSVIEQNDAYPWDPKNGVGANKVLEIPRQLEDTIGIRGIFGWEFGEKLETNLMVGYDSSSVKPEYLDASFSDADKYSVGLGARYAPIEGLSLLLSYHHDFYAEVNSPIGENRQEPAMSGIYNDSRGFLNLSIEGTL